jgi:hypothetical protein
MSTSHSRKISRSTAELLLDGHAGPDADQLARVLAAAGAPARDGELAGEQMAVAAFEANHLVPVATPQKEHKSMLTKLLTAKVLLATVAGLATGGVALAAGTGALTGSGSAHVTAGTTQPTAGPSSSSIPTGPAPSAPASAQPTGSASSIPTGPAPSAPASAQPTVSPSPTSSSLPRTAAGLCTALAGDVDSVAGTSLSPAQLVQALSSDKTLSILSSAEFTSLVSEVQEATNVPDYCALLLDLPQLPDPGTLAQLPSTVLGQLLTALPTSTLSSILTSLPTATLSQVLTALPTSALSTILTSLPSSALATILTSLPTSVVSKLLASLPTSVVSQLPSSVLSLLPTSILPEL